jgi:hypothetical protein
VLHVFTRARLTWFVHYLASFGVTRTDDPSAPTWWGDRMGYFDGPDAAVDAAYALYESAFVRLREFTIFKTHLSRDEFREILHCPTTYNVGVFSEGALVAVCALDTRVDQNALLNPNGIAKVYPDEFARGDVYFCWFMAIDESNRRSMAAFTKLVTSITDFVAPRRGCVLFDAMTSRGKVAPLRFAQLIESHSKRFATSVVEELEAEIHFGITLSPLSETETNVDIDLRDADVSAERPLEQMSADPVA